MKSQKFTNRRSERGATLVEVLVAGFIGLAIAVIGLYVLNARVRTVEDIAVANEAEIACESAISSLSATPGALGEDGDEGSFETPNDNVLTLLPCTQTTCDYVLEPDVAENLKTSPAKGFPYGSALPSEARIRYLRRWKIEAQSDTYGLRKITVAILRNETDTKPIINMTTSAGNN